MLLQVLSEELKHHIQLLLFVDHIQLSAREGSVSGCGIWGPNTPLLPFPAHLIILGYFSSFSREISLMGTPSVSL